MSKETKSLSVIPSDEQRTIDEMQAFGWELVSSQEIATKDSHLERHGDTLYSVTESENYVKLFFSRDTSIENYAELDVLYRQYLEYPNVGRPGGRIKKLLAFILCITIWPAGIIYIIWGLVKGVQDRNQYANYIISREEKIEELMTESRKYR